jgi:MraZ protein
MLIGEFRHTLDDKKRLSLPVKFRKELGKQLVITHGLDRCLFVYPVATWKTVSEKLSGLSMGHADSRSFARFLLAGAVESEVDGAGRILIPDFLKEFAALKNKIVLAGVHTRIEIWDEDQWNGYKRRIEERADVVAEKLGQLGVI